MGPLLRRLRGGNARGDPGRRLGRLSASDLPEAPVGPAAGPIVRTESLRKVYGATVALDDVDLDVERGSVYGLVGPNGAGKSTLIGLLAGLRRPSAGSVHLGVERRRMAVMPDTPRFDPWLTAREVVDLARTMVTPGAPAQAVDDALAQSGLADVSGRRVGGFSRGMLQRLGIAATIVSSPELLVFDEPASALDPLGRYEVLELVSRLARRSTILFSSHILADVQRVCDRVGVLREGRMLYQGPLEALLTERVRHAYVVRVRGPVEPLADALRGEPWVRASADLGHGQLRVEVTSVTETETRMAGVIASAGVRLVSFEPEAADLESVFLELMS
jgi:ABC-2 type transport system ATP-binding protein